MKSDFKVPEADAGKRIDVLLAEKFSDYSRGYFQRLIKGGCVTLNGEEVLPSRDVKPGDAVAVDFEEPKKEIAAEDIKLDIIYEDADVLVLNKPAGLVVHPACGHETGTLLNALAG